MDSSVDISPTELKSRARARRDHGEPDSASASAKGRTQPTLQTMAGGTAESRELSYVQDLVNQNRVVVFSKTHCPHCSDSKTLLSGMGVPYKTIELDQMQDGGQVQNVLGNITDARTVPRIFIDGQCVGGNSELKTLDKSGQLEELLNKLEQTEPDN